MDAICVLVADNYHARIFEAVGHTGSLRERKTILCPEARLRARELGLDTSSSTFNSIGDNTSQSKHRTKDKKDIKQQ